MKLSIFYLELAELLVEQLTHKICYYQNNWYKFNSPIWIPIIDWRHYISNEAHGLTLPSHFNRGQLIQTINSAEFPFCITKHLRPALTNLTGFDTNPNLIACSNGVLDFSTGKIRDGLPEDYITRQTSVIYCEYQPTSPEVQLLHRFLEQIFPDQSERFYFISLILNCFTGEGPTVISNLGSSEMNRQAIKQFILKLFTVGTAVGVPGYAVDLFLTNQIITRQNRNGIKIIFGYGLKLGGISLRLQTNIGTLMINQPLPNAKILNYQPTRSEYKNGLLQLAAVPIQPDESAALWFFFNLNRHRLIWSGPNHHRFCIPKLQAQVKTLFLIRLSHLSLSLLAPELMFQIAYFLC
jgi:hypothetical protein